MSFTVPARYGYAIGQLLGDLLSSPSPSSDLQPVYNDIGTIVEILQFLVDAVEGLEEHMLLAMNNEGPKIYSTGQAIGQIAYDWSESMARLTTVILPASFRWLEGDIEHRLIAPIKVQHSNTETQVRALQTALAALTARVEALEDWKAVTVTPALAALKLFLTAWASTYAPVVVKVKGWFDNTATFVSFAAPLLWTTIVDSMTSHADDAHMVALDKSIIGESPSLATQLDAAAVAMWNK